MPVPMVLVRRMGVPVAQPDMGMGVAVRLAWWIVGRVVVPVM